MKIGAEQIERANSVNLPDFLMSQGFRLKKAGSEYVWQDHDSLYIKNNGLGEHGKWYRFSTQTGGDNIDFLREFMGIGFTEAVEMLNGEQYDRGISYTPPVESKNKKTDKSDISIEENSDSRRAFAYLCQTRGLDFKLVSSLVKSGKIALEYKTGNVVFKIFDENNKLVGAEKVGTSTQHKFKGIAAGTANGYGFEVKCGKGENLLFFESAVDMLSYMQINKPDNHILVSMMGVKPSIVVDTMNRYGISPENVYLCSDNDTAGNEFADRLFEEFSEMKRITPESRYKDWNDMLRNIPITENLEENKMITYGNKIWNDATDNKEKSLISMSNDEFQRLHDRFESSGINYLAYSKDGTTIMAVNDMNIDWLKQIIGNDNIDIRKSSIVHTPPDKNIIGNTEYRYIPQKEYISADRDTALKMAELMQKQNIKFSGRIYPNGKAALTVGRTDLERTKAVQQTVIDMRKQFEPKENEQENTREVIGNTEYRDIRQRQYIFSKLTPEQYRDIKPVLDENARYSGVIRDGKITFTVEKDDSANFNALLENANNISKNIEETKAKPIMADKLEFSFGFSESEHINNFVEKNSGYSFALANALIEYLDEKQHSERDIPELNVGWYDKTDFSINAVINGEQFSYEGRFDIGDGTGTGGGSFIDHIRLFNENIIKFNDEGRYTGYSSENARNTLDIFIPFLEQNSQLTAAEEKILADFKAEFPIRTFEDISEEKKELGSVSMRKVGDFYEMYGENAKTAADILGLTLMTKGGEDMIGFPDHVKDEYSEKLINAGYTVITEDAVMDIPDMNTPDSEHQEENESNEIPKGIAEIDADTAVLMIESGFNVTDLSGKVIYESTDIEESVSYLTSIEEHEHHLAIDKIAIAVDDISGRFENTAAMEGLPYYLDLMRYGDNYEWHIDTGNVYQNTAKLLLDENFEPIENYLKEVSYNLKDKDDFEKEYDLSSVTLDNVSAYKEKYSSPDKLIENEQDIDKRLFDDISVIEEIESREHATDNKPFWEEPEISGEQLGLFGDPVAERTTEIYNENNSDLTLTPLDSKLEAPETVITVYHGTTSDFDKFKYDYRGAVWTTADFEDAKRFAGNLEDSKVFKVTASLENPVRLEYGISENWDIDKSIFDAKADGHDSVIIDFKFTSAENDFYKFSLENSPDAPAKKILNTIVDAMGVSAFVPDNETISEFDRRMRENDNIIHSYVAVFDVDKLEIADKISVYEKNENKEISETEINEIPDTTLNPLDSKSEEEKENPNIHTFNIGDKFRNKNTDEISEIISLTGALPWYKDDCTVSRESGGFEITENISYDKLMNRDLYEFIGNDKLSAEKNTPEINENSDSTLNPLESKLEQDSNTVDKSETFTITDNALGEGGAKTKFKNNIAAIEILKTLENENRPATAEEKEILSKYVGWGGIAQAFDKDNKSWKNEYNQLKELLTDKEYTSARASTLDAFYTTPLVIDGIYKAIENFGFKGGNILEPAMGVGNFFGRMPEDIRTNSNLYGVEIDSISGRIAQKIYPYADISIHGFEKNKFQNGCFDLAVGNVPFGELSFNDITHGTNKLHDYFFAETIDKVKSGGVIAFVTSAGTLDKQNEAVRKQLAEKADLIGAVRLPNTAFKQNANTEVTTDIIFLQKRTELRDLEQDMPDWVHIGETADGLPINKYYEQNPDMVLGKMVEGNKLYNGRGDGTMCVPFENSDLKELLNNAVSKLSATISDEKTKDVYAKSADGNIIDIPENLRNYSFFEQDKKIYFKKSNSYCKLCYDSKNSQYKRINAFIELRDTTRELIEAQELNKPDNVIKDLQTKLNTAYDTFYEKFGLIHSKTNKRYFGDDVSYNLVAGLEKKYEKNELKEKSDIFTKRTICPPKAVEHVETAIEALTLSIAEKTKVDFMYMSNLTGMTEDELKKDLTGEIFKVPHTQNEYQTASEYLSGDIREKLKTAEEIAEYDADFNINVNALKAAMPPPLKAGDIDIRIGATWLDPKYYEQFMYELFRTPKDNRNDVIHSPFKKPKVITAEFSKHTCSWHINNKSWDWSVIVSQQYGSKKMSAYEIMEHLLNLKEPKVYKTVEEPDGLGGVKEKRVVDVDATKIVQRKADKIKAEFKKWIFKDSTRREEIVSKYNELFNSVKPREYDGSALKFPMMNADIKLHDHQKNAIAHAMFGGNTLFAHCVGAGKTFEMIATAMESKRLGLCTKSMFAVPNHLTEQIGDDFQKLYPSANVLVATKKDFKKENRQQLFAKIATGNYDAVIVGHSQLGMIPISKERQEMEIQSQINDIIEGIAELKAQDGSNFQVKAMERTKKSLEKQLQKLEKKHDDTITFEQLGIDKLFVDEAHEFKNLFCATKLNNISGISNSASQKALDLYMKCRYLDEKTGGKGVTFATGTPVDTP